MSILVLTSDTLIGTPATGNIEYNGQFFGTDSNASRAQIQRITQGTAVASTSGTSIAFTSIPSWVKRITIMFGGVSTSGATAFLIQLGTGGTPTYTTSGYSAYGAVITSSVISGAVNTTGFQVGNSSSSTNAYGGSCVLTNVTSNSWASNAFFAASALVGNGGLLGAGSISLAAALTALRITAGNGTDTFTAGSINILYEG